MLNEFNLGFNIQRKFSFMKFHKIGYHTIKKYSDAPVSSAHAMVMFDPSRRYDRFDAACADYLDVSCNEFFFHAMRTGEVIVPPLSGNICNIPVGKDFGILLVGEMSRPSCAQLLQDWGRLVL